MHTVTGERQVNFLALLHAVASGRQHSGTNKYSYVSVYICTHIDR